MIFRTDMDGNPVFEGRRWRTQVNDYVVDGTAGASDQLGFGVWCHLKMHPTQRTALSVKRDTALEQIRIQAMSIELATAEGARQESPFILDSLGCNDKSSLEH